MNIERDAPRHTLGEPLGPLARHDPIDDLGSTEPTEAGKPTVNQALHQALPVFLGELELRCYVDGLDTDFVECGERRFDCQVNGDKYYVQPDGLPGDLQGLR